MLDDIFMTMSTSTGLYPKLDLWTANKLQLQLQKFSHERDIEVGAVKIFVNSVNICILSIYRAPSGNFALFLDKL